MFERFQEIAGCKNCESERAALRDATEKMRQIQQEKLGFPEIEAIDRARKNEPKAEMDVLSTNKNSSPEANEE